MKYLKRFANAQEAATVLATWTFNTISTIKGQDGARFSEGVPIGPDYSIPFYVEDVSGSENTLQIKKTNNYATTLTIEKSIDGETWETMGTTSTTAITATIPTNGKLYLRCNTTTWYGGHPLVGAGYNYIVTTGDCNVGGNTMSLLYGSDFTGNETAFPNESKYTFNALFYGATHIIDSSNLILPATTMVESCYWCMFRGCTSLTTTPKLPATTLAKSCYGAMFMDCKVLTTAPTLPITTLVQGCYSGMFEGCTSLTTAPVLPATILVDTCYATMFKGCTNLNYIKCLATDISASKCTSDWVNGVAATGTFVKAASMSGWTTDNNGIPSGWNVEDAV